MNEYLVAIKRGRSVRHEIVNAYGKGELPSLIEEQGYNRGDIVSIRNLGKSSSKKQKPHVERSVA